MLLMRKENHGVRGTMDREGCCLFCPRTHELERVLKWKLCRRVYLCRLSGGGMYQYLFLAVLRIMNVFFVTLSHCVCSWL